ncbi:MAG: hypothetical protein VX438_09305, partial [Planctomycetota bacterium]|nr:hypothetical protein [Planctomycetota bacterium]
MNIQILHSVPIGSHRGNEITALRWQSLLTELSHNVSVGNELAHTSQLDCLFAIHAIHSNDAIKHFKNLHPRRPIFVCLSGTDLHGIFPTTSTQPVSDNHQAMAWESLELANRILLLEPEGQKKLPSK